METKGKRAPQTLRQDVATRTDGQLFCVEAALCHEDVSCSEGTDGLYNKDEGPTAGQASCSSASCVHLTCDSRC